MEDPNEYVLILAKALRMHANVPPVDIGLRDQPAFSYGTHRIERETPKGWRCNCGTFREAKTCEHVLDFAMRSIEGKEIATDVTAKMRSLFKDFTRLQSLTRV